MKIALVGYGKMGKMIEGIALERGHEISCRIDKDNLEDFDSEAFRNSDAAIEFSTPSTAMSNLKRCFAAGVPTVCGTTGWTSHLDEMREICESGHGTLLWSSNFSIGVNIFMAVNRYLAKIMDSFAQYTPSMTEIHHIHKLDHPSGTAITLAEQIITETGRVKGWEEPETPAENAGTNTDAETAGSDSAAENAGTDCTSANEAGESVMLEIAHRREGEIPGIHTIEWDSDVDTITLTHSAKSRAGFALGAVMAAEWLSSRKGFRTMGEMLNDITKQEIFR